MLNNSLMLIVIQKFQRTGFKRKIGKSTPSRLAHSICHGKVFDGRPNQKKFMEYFCKRDCIAFFFICFSFHDKYQEKTFINIKTSTTCA